MALNHEMLIRTHADVSERGLAVLTNACRWLVLLLSTISRLHIYTGVSAAQFVHVTGCYKAVRQRHSREQCCKWITKHANQSFVTLIISQITFLCWLFHFILLKHHQIRLINVHSGLHSKYVYLC